MKKNLFTAAVAALLLAAILLTDGLILRPVRADSIDEEFAAYCESSSTTEAVPYVDATTGNTVTDITLTTTEHTGNGDPVITTTTQRIETPAAGTRKKKIPTESPFFYSEDQAIQWAKDNGMDGFAIRMVYSDTFMICGKYFSSREEAQAYLDARKEELIIRNGGTATIQGGFVVVDGSVINDTVYTERKNSYNRNPIVSLLPVIETDCTEHLSQSAKNWAQGVVAEALGVDSKKIIRDQSYYEGVARMTFSYTNEKGTNIATYIITTEMTPNGERMVLRPEKVLTKRISDSYADVEYAVYEFAKMPRYQATMN